MDKRNSFLENLDAAVKKQIASSQQQCQFFANECRRLEQIAAQWANGEQELLKDALSRTVRQEFASGSDMHRGYFCPSPVQDLLIGNTHRGRLLKRLTTRSKPSHEYGMDDAGRLLWCTIHDGDMTYDTEYLIYEANRILGIQFQADGVLSCITEEIYQEGKLVCLTQADIFPGSPLCCTSLRAERYQYDDEGLCGCEMHEYSAPVSSYFLDDGFGSQLIEQFSGALFLNTPLCRCDRYRFFRNGGLLTGYEKDGQIFEIRKERKA